MDKKVLSIGPDYRFPNGGIAKLLNTYSKILPDFSFVATMRAPENKKESKVKTLGRFIIGLSKMSYKILFNHYKLVHIHTASGISFLRESIFLYIAKLLGAKTILHMHSGSLVEWYTSHPKYTSRIFNMTDKVVTIARVWQDFLNIKGHKNVVTIGNPIQLPNPMTRNKACTINLLFLGLICDNKGIWDILEVVKNNASVWENKVLLRVGGNGDVTKLKEYIRIHNLGNLVEYLGWIEGEDKDKILSETDIYLQPSYREALGIAILEAMSYKIPVIASNTGGIPEIVENGVNGLLISPGNLDELCDAINLMINSKDLRVKMGEAGHKRAQLYYPNEIKSKLLNLYNEIDGE